MVRGLFQLRRKLPAHRFDETGELERILGQEIGRELLQGEEILGRPVYTRQMPDGSLLIADDYAGAIYRVAYQR